MDRARRSDPTASSTRSSRLEDLLALAVALLAEERGVSLDDVRQELWPALPAAADEMATALLPIRAVKARVGLSTATVYRLMQRGTFPRPRKVGQKSLWRSDEVEAWILSRERRGADTGRLL
ncbi:hypothetical protein ASD72_12925 [Pseudoxanthomonas sp. Root630]|nr:hypothetical protein ASD72_12925 [Pseudoxanthomonas sp. Root630]